MYFNLFSRRWMHKPDGVPTGGVDPQSETQQPVDDGKKPDAPAQEQQTFSADYVKSLREEAKSSRLELKRVSDELDAIKRTAGDNAELTKRLDQLTGDLTKAQEEAQKATQRADLVRLAAKAGVPVDIVEMLDLSKIDMTDEIKALEQLGKFAVKSMNGSHIKPGSLQDARLTDAQLRDEIYGGKRANFFQG